MYILTNNNIVLYVSELQDDIVLYLNNKINNDCDLLKKYSGDHNKYLNDLQNLKINYYDMAKGLIGYYHISNSYKFCGSNDKLPILNQLDIKKTNVDISSIFFDEKEELNCNLKILKQDIVTENTENIINDIIYDTTTKVKEFNESIETTKLKQYLNDLMIRKEKEEKHQRQINKQIEKKIKTDQEKWELHVRKYLINRKIYFQFISENRTDETIPELFTLPWKIFTTMAQQNNLSELLSNIDANNIYLINNEHHAILDKELKIYDELDLEFYKTNQVNDKYKYIFTFDDPFLQRKMDDNNSDSEIDTDYTTDEDN